MDIDFNTFKVKLAKNKVYDACVFVESLEKNIFYVDYSLLLSSTIHENRINILQGEFNKIIETAIEEGHASLTSESLLKTHINIFDLNISDTVIMKKTVMEFFHYARLCFDLFFQIVNKSLFASEAIDINDQGIIRKTIEKLKQNSTFSNITKLLDDNKNNELYKYVQAYDNYTKHISNISTNISENLFNLSEKTFAINEFTINGTIYAGCDAIKKMNEVYEYIITTTSDLLQELTYALSNNIGTEKRIQDIKFCLVQTEDDNKIITGTDYICFYIETDSAINYLKPHIEILPLRIESDTCIHATPLDHDTIFIKDIHTKKIIGMATIDAHDAGDLYRKYIIQEADQSDLDEYIITFKSNYSKLNINFNSVLGKILIYDPKNIKKN